jgi:transcriptional regulator with XRE-family HTH domain
MGKEHPPDPSMSKVQKAIDASGMSRQELGEKMGYDAKIARQAVYQLLKTSDPRIGTLRKLAKALGVKVNDLI